MQQHYITRIIPGLFIFLYVYTAASKIWQFDFFAAQLQLYPILSKAPLLIAATVPAAELMTALLLFFERTVLKGLYASLLLLFLFTLYLVLMVFTQPDLPCTCGGVISKLTWPQHIFFNCFMLCLNITAIVTAHRKQKQNSLPALTSIT